MNNGFTPLSQFKPRPRLILGIEGLPDTGKTEFSLTAPPGIGVLAVDRGYEHVITKAVPPTHRQKDISLKIFPVPQPGENPGDGSKAVYGSYKEMANIYKNIWDEYAKWYKTAIACPDFRTVVIDGDSDTWDLQQLASFGKVVQVPPLQRTDVNAARRIMIARAFDSGKNIIYTYRIKPEYENKVRINARGVATEVGERTGEYKRVGFGEQDYVVQVQLRSLYESSRAGQEENKYGVRIMKCKPSPELVGFELWGGDNNFKGLVEAIYPDADPKEWGL